jgi:hypothetical protein
MEARKCWPCGILGLACLLLGHTLGNAIAKELFQVTLESPTLNDGISETVSFKDAQDAANQLDSGNLTKIFPGYNETVPISGNFTVRGLQATAFFNENSSLLFLDIPCAGINDKEFGTASGSRNESVHEMKDFLTSAGGEQKDILKCFVSDTPIDPVAGNPNSLMAKMASADYAVGIRTDAGEDNLSSVGGEIGYSKAQGYETKYISLPLNYVLTIPKQSGPPYAFILDMPLRYVDLEGADIFDGSLGLGFRAPILNRWSLTPVVRAGLVGSTNTGSVQSIYSGSTTSRFDFYVGDLRLSVNNMVGYFHTGKISGGDFSQDYDVENVIFRNGLSAEGSLDFTLFDDPTSWEIQYIDTRITGDDWYNNWYDEIVVSVGTRQRATRMKWQDLRVATRYTFGDNFDRVELAINYRF